MTRRVVAVGPEATARHVAELLLEHRISAVPVLDGDGRPIGMVSEGDLVGRNDAEREARRDWWLSLLAEGEAISPEFLAHLAPGEHAARDLMSAPLITVTEDTDVSEIARLLAAYRIKRVPVLRDGRVVGIVSRADLLRALAAASAEKAGPGAVHEPALFAWIDRQFRAGEHDAAHTPAAAPADEEPVFSAAQFRRLERDFETEKERSRRAAREAANERRRARMKELIDTHISDEGWRSIIHNARRAAERGENKFLLLRFPSQLCTDGGRRINNGDPSWPATLRGEAAEAYLRWEHELKPRGFLLAAEVLEFPGGMPGDVGQFLVWG